MHKRQPLAIYGAGPTGRQLAFHILTHFTESHQLIGFIDDERAAGTRITLSLEAGAAPVTAGSVFGSLNEVSGWPGTSPDHLMLLLAVGSQDMARRRRAFQKARDLGYRFMTLIHPGARIEQSARIGDGTVILNGAVIDQGATLGDAAFVDIGVLIGDQTRTGLNCWFGAGARTQGRCRIGRDSRLDLGAMVMDDVTIGDGCVIGPQWVVSAPLKDGARLIGERTPARQGPIARTRRAA